MQKIDKVPNMYRSKPILCSNCKALITLESLSLQQTKQIQVFSALFQYNFVSSSKEKLIQFLSCLKCSQFIEKFYLMTSKLYTRDFKSKINLYSLKENYMQKFQNLLQDINQKFNLCLDLSFQKNLLKKKDLDSQKIPEIQAGILIHKIQGIYHNFIKELFQQSRGNALIVLLFDQFQKHESSQITSSDVNKFAKIFYKDLVDLDFIDELKTKGKQPSIELLQKNFSVILKDFDNR